MPMIVERDKFSYVLPVSMLTALVLVMSGALPSFGRTNTKFRNTLAFTPADFQLLDSDRYFCCRKVNTVGQRSATRLNLKENLELSWLLAAGSNIAGFSGNTSNLSMMKPLCADSALNKGMQILKHEKLPPHSYEVKTTVDRQSAKRRHFREAHKIQILGGLEAFPL